VAGENGQSFIAGTGLWAVQLSDGVCVDTSACVQVLSTGVDERAARAIVLHPNPTDGPLELQLPTAWIGGDQLTLCDASGRTVLEVRVNTARAARLDLSGLAPGVYVLRSASGEAARVVRK
jgi:hypothetical protein